MNNQTNNQYQINQSDNTSMKQNEKTQQFIIWIAALILGTVLGCFEITKLNNLFNLIAAVFTRLFQFVAVPTISLAVITTLSDLSAKKNMGKIFFHTVLYTLLTTFAAATTALVLYIIFTPDNIPLEIINQNLSNISANKVASTTYYEHFISVIPNNIIQPLLSGNVLSIILISAAMGIGLSYSPDTENKKVLKKLLLGVQELMFTLIRALIKILPVGIVAFSAQLSSQIVSNSIINTFGKYVAIVILGNLLQIFIIIPIFLLVKRLNPINIFKNMLPALAVAFFTKSSVATLPVTLTTVENKININPEISRFVLPICTTVNMNGCAAFILISSLFVMQNSGIEINLTTMIIWLFISVFAAIGNAGVPMGCYFLTLSLMSSIGASCEILGIILPIYTVIDMIETVENVWSDSSVCIMTDKDFQK